MRAMRIAVPSMRIMGSVRAKWMAVRIDGGKRGVTES
jgi:hypothetical protein